MHFVVSSQICMSLCWLLIAWCNQMSMKSRKYLKVSVHGCKMPPGTWIIKNMTLTYFWVINVVVDRWDTVYVYASQHAKAESTLRYIGPTSLWYFDVEIRLGQKFWCCVRLHSRYTLSVCIFWGARARNIICIVLHPIQNVYCTMCNTNKLQNISGTSDYACASKNVIVLILLSMLLLSTWKWLDLTV